MVSATAERAHVDVNEDSKALHAVLFELDTVAIAGRVLLFEITKRLLAEKDVAITDKLFTRYCIDLSPRVYVKILLETLGKTRVSHEKLAQDIQSTFRAEVTANAQVFSTGVRKILDHARTKQHELGALTTLDAEAISASADILGIKDTERCFLSFNSETHLTPTAHEWLRLTKQMAIRPNACLAIVSSMRACKAALAAGLRSIVICDRFTSFQDYGGADYVIPTLDDASVKTITEMITHRSRMS